MAKGSQTAEAVTNDAAAGAGSADEDLKALLEFKAQLERVQGELEQTKKDLESARKQGASADLKAQLEQAVGERNKALGQVLDLKGQLKDKTTELAELKASVAASSASLLPDLGKDAFELLESVTILDHEGNRASPRKGDVVTLREPSPALREKLEGKARIYQIDEKHADELFKRGFLRV